MSADSIPCCLVFLAMGIKQTQLWGGTEGLQGAKTGSYPCSASALPLDVLSPLLVLFAPWGFGKSLNLSLSFPFS